MAGDGHAGMWVVVYVGVREGMRSVFFFSWWGGSREEARGKQGGSGGEAGGKRGGSGGEASS